MTRSPGARAAYDARPRPMAAPDDATLGRQARKALWSFAAQTRLQGVARDKAAYAFIRAQHPKVAEAFTRAQLTSVVRELQGGACSWDALRAQLTATDEPMPTPTAGLTALLGPPCQRCQAAFRAVAQQRDAAQRERARLAAAATRLAPTPTRVVKRRAYYGSRPVGESWK